MAYIGVIGPGQDATPADLAAAAAVGAGLAAGGHIVLTGGLGGVMSAAAEGASTAGGFVVGLLPGEDRAAGNPFLGVALPTGMGEMRNALLVRCSDAVIAIGGSWGTLSEISLAVRTAVPLVRLGGWDLPASDAQIATDPDDAVAKAVQSASR